MEKRLLGGVLALVLSATVAQPAAAQYELNIVGSVNVSNGPNPLDALLDFSSTVAAVETTTLPGISPFPTFPFFLTTVGAMNDVVVGDPALARPLCVNCPVSPLLTIAGYTFTLTGLTAGTPPADIIFGPVELSSTGSIGTSATMSGFGTVTGGVFGAAVRPFTVSFHASFDRDTPAGLVAAIVGGGTRNVAFGADFLVNTVPEPATLALMGTGLVALFGIGFRRRTNV